MINNQVVVRYLDGRVVKGITHDFGPDKAKFHLIADAKEHLGTVISTDDLKAVFFVRSLVGNRRRIESPDWEGLKTARGVTVKVTFVDGEVIFGTAEVYGRRRRGFFLRPADPGSNNERVYVVTKATTRVDAWR